MGSGEPRTWTISLRRDRLKMHHGSFSFSPFRAWTSGLGHPCAYFWSFFLRFKEVSFPASLQHIGYFSASQGASEISPGWPAPPRPPPRLGPATQEAE